MMKRGAYMGIGVTATLAAAVCAAVAFVVSGAYNIGADDHHTRPVLMLIETLRDRSIAVRAGFLNVPAQREPSMLAAGAARYANLCAGCHLSPGVSHSVLGAGLYPHPPDLAQADITDPRRAFWVIKHGIKMSAMPAWGRSLDDDAIWDLVAFIRELPTLSAQDYQQLSARSP